MKFACRSTPDSRVSSAGAVPDRRSGRRCIASTPGRMSTEYRHDDELLRRSSTPWSTSDVELVDANRQ